MEEIAAVDAAEGELDAARCADTRSRGRART